jgi:hypothetical protein
MHHLNGNPQPLINALHWNIYNGALDVEKDKLLALYAYTVANIDHFNAFVDTEIAVGRIVYKGKYDTLCFIVCTHVRRYLFSCVH